MGHARQTADGKQHNQTNRKFHRRGEPQFATPHRECPVDDFDTSWHGNRHRRQREHGYRDRPETRSKHVVGPNTPTNKTNRRTREHNKRITKQWLARKHRQNFRHDAERRQDQNINLGVTENPK